MKNLVFICAILLAICLNLRADADFGDFDDFDIEYQKSERISDPFYKTNTKILQLNVALFNMTLRPLAGVYDAFTFPVVKRGVGNFFSNLSAPLRFISLIFSGRFTDASKVLGGFMINSTAGIFGLIEIAPHGAESDFGLAAARWGVPSGPYLQLPILGPSNLRDALFKPLDFLLSPSVWLKPLPGLALSTSQSVNTMSKYRALIDEGLKSVNSYALLRDWYEQKRKDDE